MVQLPEASASGTYQARDQDDEQQVKADVDRRQYTERGVVAVLGDFCVVGDARCVRQTGDDGVPDADAAENSHRTENVFVLQIEQQPADDCFSRRFAAENRLYTAV
jgi:hypothetical protein